MDRILQATSGRGLDLILETLANVNLGHDLKLLAPHGRIVVIGSRGDVTIAPGLFAGMENGTLRPVIGEELSADAARAHNEILEPCAYGKIVLLP